MKRLFILLTTLIGCMYLLGSIAFASTEYELDTITKRELIYGITGDKQTAPFKVSDAGVESINTASGNLSFEATDLALKGKAGMDLVIKRRYNSQIQDDYQDCFILPGSLNTNNTKHFSKLLYRYYVNNSNPPEPIYIAFETEEQMLNAEDENAQIKLASNFRNSKITKWSGDGENYSVDTSNTSLDFNSIANAGFYLFSYLPQGTEVTLTRDIYTSPAILYYSTIYSFGKQYYSWDDLLSVGYGWYIPTCGINYKGTALDKQSPINYYYTEYGEFNDPEGNLLSYSIEYRESISSGLVTVLDCQIYGEEESNIYSLYVDDFWGYALYKGIQYRCRIERYDGTTLYLDDHGRMVLQEDRFGNTITYRYTRDNNYDTIIDSYGRTISFIYNETPGDYSLQKIMVDGKTVVTYQKSMENGLNDPNDVLQTDNTYILTIKYGDTDICNNEITYKSKLRQDIIRLYYPPSGVPVLSNYKCKSTEKYQTYCIEEVIYPTGGKTVYLYDKVFVYNWNGDTSRDKRKIHDRKELLEDNDTPYNHYVYTYNNPSEGLKKNSKPSNYTHTTTITRQSDGFTTYDTYDKDDYLTENKTQSQNNVVKTTYEYQHFNEGNKKIKKETVQEYNSLTPTQYVERITDRTYNNYQQLTFEKQGDFEVSYGYGSYGLMTSKTIKRNSEYKTYIAYELSSDRKTIGKEKVYDVKISTGTETLKESRTFNYNNCGELTTITQSPDGNADNNIVITTNYNYLNVQDTVNNPDKNTLILTTTVNNVANITDDNGNVINGASVSTTKVFDLFGNEIQSTDGRGNNTYYQYDSLNRIIKQTNPDSTYKSVDYYNDLNEIIATDENGNKIKYSFDSLGRYTDAYAYNPDIKEWILAENVTYDNAGRIHTKTINIKEDGSQKAVVIYDYYPNGRLWKETVRDGSITGKLLSFKEYTYTEYVNDSTYGPCNKVKIAIQRDDSNVTNVYLYYNNLGRLVKEEVEVKQPNGSIKKLVQTYTYDYVGNKLTIKDFRANDENWPESYTSKFDYDYAGRIIKAYNINTTNNYIEYEYDRLGRKIKEYDYLRNATTYKYNALNQLIETISPFEGNITRRSVQYYDKNGNLMMQLQQSNKQGEAEKYDKVAYRYNSMNRLTAVINYDTSDNNKTYVTQYDYDAVGNITKMFTGLNCLINTSTETGNDNDFAVTRYEYNYLNQRISVKDPLQKTIKYKYDMLGNVREMLDRLQVTTTYDYDPFGKLTGATVNKNGNISFVGYGYDYAGNRVTMTDGSSTTYYKYDDLNRLIEEQKLTDGTTKEYTYDANGNRKSFKLTVCGNEQMNVTYTYNKLNQLEYVYYGGTQVAYYQYDKNGNRKTLITGGITTSYLYNKANLLTSLTNQKGSTILSQFNYTYYYNGNLANETQSGMPQKSYVYDGLGRLKSETQNGTTVTYTFDDYHNRYIMNVSGANPYSVTYKYDKNNRLETETKTAGGIITITDYDYDDNGNLLKKNDGTETTYQYDGFNRLINIQTPTSTISYNYNGDGLRTSKNINGNISSQIWDGQNIVMEISGPGYVAAASNPDRFDTEESIGMYVFQQMETKKYIRGINLIASEGKGGASTRQYYLFNGHGDTVQLTNSVGNVIKNYEYDAFGIEKNPDANDTNPFRYCGEYYDEETGFYYLRARYYDPATSRMLSEDPARDGTNWYVYCFNNPVNLTDPTGLAAGDPFKTIDDAAIDFGQEYYSTSDYIMLELATLIYSYTDADGNTMYSYVAPVIGDPHSVQPLDVQGDLPEGSTMAAAIHQHPNSTEFSDADRNFAKHPSVDAPLYVVVPGNTLKVYENSGTVDDTGNAIWSERTVSTDLQLRGLSIAEKIALTYTYKSKWDTHTGTTCGFGCADKTWPRTKSGNAESWNVDDSSDSIKDWINSILSKRYKQ